MRKEEDLKTLIKLADHYEKSYGLTFNQRRLFARIKLELMSDGIYNAYVLALKYLVNDALDGTECVLMKRMMMVLKRYVQSKLHESLNEEESLETDNCLDDRGGKE